MYIYIHVYIHSYIHTHIYVCVCVCVCTKSCNLCVVCQVIKVDFTPPFSNCKIEASKLWVRH